MWSHDSTLSRRQNAWSPPGCRGAQTHRLPLTVALSAVVAPGVASLSCVHSATATGQDQRSSIHTLRSRSTATILQSATAEPPTSSRIDLGLSPHGGALKASGAPYARILTALSPRNIRAWGRTRRRLRICGGVAPRVDHLVAFDAPRCKQGVTGSSPGGFSVVAVRWCRSNLRRDTRQAAPAQSPIASR